MKTTPITVAQMLPDLHSGGVERGTLELGDYLVRQGHRSIVISEGGPMVATLEKQGSRHIRLPVGGKNPITLSAVLPLRRLLLREQIDILHLRSRVPAWVGYLAFKSLSPSLRPRLVTTFHGFYSINAYSAIMTRGEKSLRSRTRLRRILKPVTASRTIEFTSSTEALMNNFLPWKRRYRANKYA